MIHSALIQGPDKALHWFAAGSPDKAIIEAMEERYPGEDLKGRLRLIGTEGPPGSEAERIAAGIAEVQAAGGLPPWLAPGSVAIVGPDGRKTWFYRETPPIEAAATMERKYAPCIEITPEEDALFRANWDGARRHFLDRIAEGVPQHLSGIDFFPHSWARLRERSPEDFNAAVNGYRRLLARQAGGV